jgi:hypothetical protein
MEASMVIEKEYILKKTAKSTASANGLEISHLDHSYLFDFSLLSDSGIPEEDKEEIKESALAYVTPAFRDNFSGKAKDQFDWFNAYVNYQKTSIYNEDGKRLYVIFSIKYLHYQKFCSECCYDEPDTQTIKKVNQYTAPDELWIED